MAANAGVQKLVNIERSHSDLVGCNAKIFLKPETDDTDLFAVTGHANAANTWQGKRPAKGTKQVVILQKKVCLVPFPY